jgi:hypothetical protein
MGLCGSKQTIKWQPLEDDNQTSWMEDYDGMMAQMIEDDASPDQWELDLAKEGLMNPNFSLPTDLKFGHNKTRRSKMWFEFKKAIHGLKGDRSDGMIKTVATVKLGASPYLQMRAKQWMDKLKKQIVNTKNLVSNRRASTQDGHSQSKYAAAMESTANSENKE